MILALVILSSTFFSSIFITYLMLRRTTKSKNVVQYPKVIFVEGILCIIVSVILLCVLILKEEYDPLIVLLIPFAIGVYLTLKSFVWRIEYEKELFVFRNNIGIKRCYRYEDIFKVIVKKDKYYILIFAHNKITIDMMAINSECFWNEIRKKRHRPIIIEKK